MIQPNNYRIDEAKYKSLLKYIRLKEKKKYEFHSSLDYRVSSRTVRATQRNPI